MTQRENGHVEYKPILKTRSAIHGLPTARWCKTILPVEGAVKVIGIQPAALRSGLGGRPPCFAVRVLGVVDEPRGRSYWLGGTASTCFLPGPVADVNAVEMTRDARHPQQFVGTRPRGNTCGHPQRRPDLHALIFPFGPLIVLVLLIVRAHLGEAAC
jgi:hypothetical protein